MWSEVDRGEIVLHETRLGEQDIKTRSIMGGTPE